MELQGKRRILAIDNGFRKREFQPLLSVPPLPGIVDRFVAVPTAYAVGYAVAPLPRLSRTHRQLTCRLRKLQTIAPRIVRIEPSNFVNG